MSAGRLIPRRWAVAALLGAVAPPFLSDRSCAAIVNGDALEVALAAPNDYQAILGNSFDVFASDKFEYDDNIYRLAPGITDLQDLNGIGPNATRTDRINITSVGADAVWNPGRQLVSLDLRVDDNRFAQNTNLDNVSTADKLVWNWNVGGLLTGEAGATYDRALSSFINAPTYAQDIYSVTSYYGTGRYQLGPSWAVYGGLLDSHTTLSDVALRSNDIDTKSVEVGTEYATGPKNSVGVEYRFIDATYPLGSALSDDYREDAARFVVRYAFSDKTNINANAGFLKRDYQSPTIPSFSGDVWRVTGNWLPTDKVQVEVDAWRNLQAYVTAQSDYYVSRGERIAPQWAASQKIQITLILSYEQQDYIGLTESQITSGLRRDTLTTASTTLTYTPFSIFALDFGYAYEKRGSNEPQYEFNDNVFSVKATVKFGGEPATP